MPSKTTKKSKPGVRIISSKVVFRGPAFQITSDQVKEPGGRSVVRRDVIRHSGSVVILPMAEATPIAASKGRKSKSLKGEPKILLERQYRYSTNQFLWELPAGGIDEGEDELPAAQRELLEETGYTAKSWKRILFFYPSPGILDETVVVYLARGLNPGKAQLEEDEIIRTRFFSQVLRMVMRGAIIDVKTISSTLWLDKAIQTGKIKL